jgi:hypothetical protein
MFQMDDPSLAVLLVSGAECSSAVVHLVLKRPFAFMDVLIILAWEI